MAHKGSGLPFLEDMPSVDKLPWTISYIIRKRMQIDSFDEVPKDKRPPDKMIWYGTPEEVEVWFDKVFKHKQDTDTIILEIDESEIG